MNQSIAVLITCHNRRNKTLNCLQSLYNCFLPASCNFNVFLVDDGSTDGTSEEVRSRYPETNIIAGSGNLFWNKGMHLAWESANKQNKKFNYYLWLNDDVELFENALTDLLSSAEEKKGIIVGSIQSRKHGSISYGGLDSKNKLLPPNGSLQLCHTFNGNVVLIPDFAFEKIGNLDPVFPHAIGDFDYALRARKLGVSSFISKNFLGYCEKNETLPRWCLPTVKFKMRIKSLYSPLGNAHPRYYFRFERRHYGLGKALYHFLSIHLRLFFPKLWKSQS